MDDEVELSVSLPVDSDGFLRRECPHCEREFKWLPSEESEVPPPGGYHCPYCGEQAGNDQWFTRGQLRVIEASFEEDVLGPGLRDLQKAFGEAAAASGGVLEFKVGEEQPEPTRPRRLTERNDMARIDFDCHPGEPVKVAEDWHEPVHCLVCGEPRPQ